MREFNAQHAHGYHGDGGRNDRRYGGFSSAHQEIMHFRNRIPTKCLLSECYLKKKV